MASEFDHAITGFVLDGHHTLLDYESCHVGGMFDELPRRCSQCHDNTFAVGISSTHILVVEPCDTCHTTMGFEASAMTAIMDHSVLTGQACSGCHDGIAATGKPVDHVPTISQCDACHSTADWGNPVDCPAVAPPPPPPPPLPYHQLVVAVPVVAETAAAVAMPAEVVAPDPKKSSELCRTCATY